MKSSIHRYRHDIAFARQYTVKLLDTVPESKWFLMPSPGGSHVGWQVGHLAMAQYRLVIERVRGARPKDAGTISTAFLEQFVRGTVPRDADAYPPPAEIRSVFDAVHDLVMMELVKLQGIDLESPALAPHAFCRTKAECLRWCSHHEFLHAGQIGLLRREMGDQPIW